jgi:hypothetical protein
MGGGTDLVGVRIDGGIKGVHDHSNDAQGGNALVPRTIVMAQEPSAYHPIDITGRASNSDVTYETAAPNASDVLQVKTLDGDVAFRISARGGWTSYGPGAITESVSFVTGVFVLNSATQGANGITIAGPTYTGGLYAPLSMTANRIWRFQNCGGAISIVGSGGDPPGSPDVGAVNRTGATALSSDPSPAVKLTNGTPAGFYLVDGALAVTTTDAGSCDVRILFNDGIAPRTVIPLSIDTSVAGANDFNTQVVYLASGDITWDTVGLNSSAAVVTLRLRCEYLGA